jgi:MSHA biogenesis protein MshI
VAKLVLAPLGDAAPGLKEHLEANLAIPVEALKLDALLDISRAPELRESSTQQSFFMTLGAALRHEEKSL